MPLGETFQMAFEQYSRDMLQGAVNFVEGDERVQKMWVYTILARGNIEATWYFAVDGRFLTAQEVGPALGLADADPSELSSETRADRMQFLRSVMDEPGELPCRIVMDYVPALGELSAQFGYADELVSPDDLSGWKTRDAWTVQQGGKAVF